MQENIEELKWLNPQVKKALKLFSLKKFNNFLTTIQITFEASSEKLEKDIVGHLNTYIRKNATKNKEINNRIASGSFKVVDLNVQPWDVCALPNGHLLIADLNQTSLFLYDSSLKLVRTITEITDSEFFPMGIATNGINEIYIVNHCNEKIYKTDLDLNQIGECSSQGDDLNQLMHPRGIFYYNHSIYVCDCGSNRIQKFDTDSLAYQASYILDFSPSRIKIGNNIACIVGGLNNNTIYFYDVKNFKLHHKYERKSACCFIGVINSHFYEYNERKIFFYDETGHFVQEFKSGNFVFNEYNYDSGIVYFNDKVILYNYKQKKLIII